MEFPTIKIKSKLDFYSTHVYCILFVIILISCQIPDPVYPGPDPVPNNSDIPKLCELACKNMEKMNCEGWQGSPGNDNIFGTVDDVSCSDVCIDIMNQEPSITLHPKCVAEANSCERADECFINDE